MEALLLEEKLLMVNERKVRDDLRAADDVRLELNKQVRGIRSNMYDKHTKSPYGKWIGCCVISKRICITK